MEHKFDEPASSRPYPTPSSSSGLTSLLPDDKIKRARKPIADIIRPEIPDDERFAMVNWMQGLTTADLAVMRAGIELAINVGDDAWKYWTAYTAREVVDVIIPELMAEHGQSLPAAA